MRAPVSALLPVLVALLAAGCGDEPGSSGSGSGSGSGGPAKKTAEQLAAEKKAKAEKKRQREKQVAELKAEREKQKAKITDLQAAIRTLESTHKAERDAQPDVRKLQRRIMSLQRDWNSATSKYKTIQKRLDSVRDAAEKAVTGELKTLRGTLADKEKSYREVLSGWRSSLSNASVSRVEQSPVKRKLDALRFLKGEWLKLTADTRKGGAGAGARSAVSEKFREMLNTEAKAGVIKEVLARPEAGGKEPKTYDFTELDFYLLLKLHEDSLDRQNIAVEKRALGENEGKLRALEKEVDALREQIAEKMTAGGGDLERYEDLRKRVGPAKQKAESLGQQLEAFRESLGQIDSLAERQDEEMNKAVAELKAAEKALSKTNKSLRSLGAR